MTNPLKTMTKGFAADLRGALNAAREKQKYNTVQAVCEVAFNKLLKDINENPFKKFFVVSVNTEEELRKGISGQAAVSLFKNVDITDVNPLLRTYGLELDEIRIYSEIFIQISLRDIQAEVDEELENSYI